jgi:hypothetical protein
MTISIRKLRFLWLPWWVCMAACTTGSNSYDASSPVVLVRPSKGWIKPGETQTQGWLEVQQCRAEAERDPRYISLEKERKSKLDPDQSYSDQTKAERKIYVAPGVFWGIYRSECMARKGYRYGKYTNEPVGDEELLKPPPPTEGWKKPGMSREDTRKILIPCEVSARDDPRTFARNAGGSVEGLRVFKALIDTCMKEQGFVYGSLKE